MTFPQTRLDEVVELNIDGTWTDISSYVLQRDMATITRGQDDGAAYVDTGSVQYTLRNDDYRFSPRHPESPYYGVLGRNTPLRTSVALGTPFFGIPGVSGVHAEAADSAPLSITGDIEIVADVALDDWGYDGYIGLAGKPISWVVWQWGGYLWLRWYTSAVAYIEARATELTPIPLNKRQAVKITLDVNNGAGGNTATFYTAPTADGTWTQLGDPVVTAGTTNIYDSTSKVYIGQEGASAVGLTSGRMYAFQCRNGIGGSLVADVDFTTQTVGAASFVDDAGVTWTIVGSPGITNRRIRFQGEVATWPVKSDISGNDRYVTIEANGVMRRLGRCTSTLPSCLARGYLSNVDGVRAYWPCEDLLGSRSVATGMADDGYPLSINGSPDFGEYTDFLASHPLPLMRNAAFSGRVKPYAATGYHQFRFFVAIPAGGSTGGGVLMRWRTTGDVAYWELRYGTGAGVGFDPGRVRLLAYDDAGTAVFDTGATYYDMELDGNLIFIQIEINPTAGTPDIVLARYKVGEASGYFWDFDHTIADLGRVTSISVCPDNNHDDVMIGHISIQDEITSLFDARDLMNGYQYETAANRIRRLCAEAGVDFEPRGDMGNSEKCGIQTPDSLLNLLRETAQTDGGILFESRDVLGLAYAPRRTLYSQTPEITLDVETDHHLSAPLDPVDDDSSVVNDVTVVRKNGSSARSTIDTGPLSTLDPPDGVGQYEQSETLCLAYDERCKPLAEWLAAIGTINLARYPTLTLNLARAIIAEDSALLTSLLDLEQGQLIALSNLPPDQPPDTVYLMMLGSRETLEPFNYEMKLSCVPEGPFHVGIYDDSDVRYDTASSTLAANITTTGTSLVVLIQDGQLWTTDAGDMPFDIVIGGEQMRVTSVVGAASPQTFTVTRSINGIVKAHESPAPLNLYRPVHYGV